MRFKRQPGAFSTSGKMPHGLDRLFVELDSVLESRARQRLHSRLAAEVARLFPRPSGDRMMRDLLDPFVEAISIELFNRFRTAHMDGTPTVAEQARVSGFLCQGMLEQQASLWSKRNLVQEL